jgi:hypothetical protein
MIRQFDCPRVMNQHVEQHGLGVFCSVDSQEEKTLLQLANQELATRHTAVDTIDGIKSRPVSYHGIP